MSRLLRSTRSLGALTCLAFGLVGCMSSQDGATPASHLAAALSAAQCDYFAADGKVRICHATGSTKNPYVVLKVSEHACIDGHTHHAGDYVATNDPTCGGKGFLPPGAPCDTTLPCSIGYTCRDAICAPTDLCLGVLCSASDQCHVAHCDPTSGLCVDEPKVDGFACDDGDACTRSDTCQAGTCAGADPVSCAASDACHDAGTCDPTSGLCSNPVAADGTACNDSDACTRSDTCQAGTCAGADPVSCTASDACHAVGTCDPTSGLCSNPIAADGTACNDSDACTQSDTCQAGTCTGADPVVCGADPALAGSDDGCTTVGACLPSTGTCPSIVAADGTSCDDGDPLTAGDVCGAGTCAGVAPAACPCFDAAQIEAAWDAVQEVRAFGGVTTGNEPYQWCQDKTLTYGDGAVQTHTQLQFFEFSGRTGGACGYWDEYTSRDGNFLGLTFAAGPTGTATCQAGLGGGTYSCDAGGYTAAPTNYSTYISTPSGAITPAQATACKALIHTFAVGKGIPCVPVFVP